MKQYSWLHCKSVGFLKDLLHKRCESECIKCNLKGNCNYHSDDADKMIGIYNQETNRIEAVRKSTIREVLEKKRHLLSKSEGKSARKLAIKKGR